jgi:hypothetical protein
VVQCVNRWQEEYALNIHPTSLPGGRLLDAKTELQELPRPDYQPCFHADEMHDFPFLEGSCSMSILINPTLADRDLRLWHLEWAPLGFWQFLWAGLISVRTS